MIPPISTILTLRKLPLLLHIMVESAAAYTFIFKPACQLPRELSPSNSDRSSSPSSPTCFTSGSSSCPCPEQTSQPPHASKRHLSPASPSPPSPNSPQVNHKDKDNHSSDPVGEKATAAAIIELNLILRNYGGLLLTSNLLCLLFLLRPVFDELSGAVSLCTATYHVWPAYRAWARIRTPNTCNGTSCNNDRKRAAEPGKKVLGGPVVHLFVHLGLLAGLVFSGLA